MSKYIAHASIDENGKISGGSSGDQTKKEVCIRTWYSKPWNYVLRINDEKVRKQFANNMIDVANNDNVGYDQYGRNTLLTQAIKTDFNFSKIAVKCECDCSSAITICILGAVYTVLGKEEYKNAYNVLVINGNCATTSTLRSRLKKLNYINAYSSSSYVSGTSHAVFGDIYIKEGKHVACYIDDGKKVSIDSTPKAPSSSTSTSIVKKVVLVVDGSWGTNTTKRLQQIFGTTQDGIVSNQWECYKKKNPGLASGWDWDKKPNGKGSQLIKAMQKWSGMPSNKCDGEIGDDTIKYIQKKLGCKIVDGYFSKPSTAIKELQEWCNKQ